MEANIGALRVGDAAPPAHRSGIHRPAAWSRKVGATIERRHLFPCGTAATLILMKIVRDARVHRVLEGANEIMRLIVSRQLLGETA